MSGDQQSSDQARLTIRLDERDAGIVAYLTLDNPRRLNAMNSALMEELVATMLRLGAEARLRAVVLSGAGAKAFTAGADIGEMANIKTPGEARAFITRLHRCCAAIRDCPAPVIARVQGYCFGGGLEIAAACDLRIVAETASFGMQEVKIGIPSVIEAALLPTLVGWGRAREIMYLGETFTAREALDWGLVERVVEASALDAAVETCIAALLRSKPGAVRRQKQLMRQWEELPLGAAIAAGIDAFAATYETGEPIAAMREFLAAQTAKKRSN